MKVLSSKYVKKHKANRDVMFKINVKALLFLIIKDVKPPNKNKIKGKIKFNSISSEKNVGAPRRT